ncbi:receptor-transporting protein 4-like [Phyllobates terribilis]|uniref:receptor-transporting protein 4-like n=1 Tax=Phyllobates terribilis TaxID=111132 RepID=UPI003CCB4A18
MNNTAWIEDFASEIGDLGVPHRWCLHVDKNLLKKDDAKYCSQRTFGSFHCLYCQRNWNSSKVFILFCMKLNQYQRHGNVAMRIFKQGCQKCMRMQEPTIQSENIERVISNVVSHIQKVFYGQQDVNDDRPPKIYGPLDGPHDEEHCEACQLNLCDRQMSSQETSSSLGWISALAGVGIGVGALALMYLSKNDDENVKKAPANRK